MSATTVGNAGSLALRDLLALRAIDQASMIDHLAALAPGASLGLIGHSFGGQVLGLADNIASIRVAVLVCSQSGHWRHWPPGRARLRMLAL